MSTGSDVDGTTHLTIYIQGNPVNARQGQTVADILIQQGFTTLRYSPDGQPRGLFCGMGLCFECLVTIDGQENQQACLERVKPQMEIRLGSPPIGQHEPG